MLLLDTHVLVWLAEGLDALPPAARRSLARNAASSGLGVSAISFWEVAMLAQRGRISLSVPLARWRERTLAARGMRELPVDGAVAIEAVELPGNLHADPADRLLVATARVHGLRLVTRDQRLLEYGAAGHVRILEV